MNHKTILKISLVVIAIIVGTEGTIAQGKLDLYGYFSTRFEKTFSTTGPNGTIFEADPSAWTYPYVNIMMQYQPAEKFKVFVNLNGSNAANINVQNLWGEYTFDPAFVLRVGKMYRKFGLYNEILDAVPTYYGIEPPEIFDGDHLMLSRTTIFMVYGGVDIGPGTLNYSATTDNGEGDPLNDPVKGVFPIGYDLNYNFGNGDYKVGVSGYTSNGEALPNVDFGGGSPKSGVLPWMAKDEFSVFGGYGEARLGNLTLQAEYWGSPHSADRDPSKILTLLSSAGLNSVQKSRFMLNPNGSASDPNNIRLHSDFTISTWYFRAGYSFETSYGEIAPYVQWDYYSNPETIAKKKFGGDNEAGMADDGIFNKSTIGLIFRPIPQVAVKFDQSYHFYKLNGEDVKYPEVRLDISFIFGH